MAGAGVAAASCATTGKAEAASPTAAINPNDRVKYKFFINTSQSVQHLKLTLVAPNVKSTATMLWIRLNSEVSVHSVKELTR
jgi:hypothetical protein